MLNIMKQESKRIAFKSSKHDNLTKKAFIMQNRKIVFVFQNLQFFLQKHIIPTLYII